jgi:hypothetical protein
MYLSKQDYIIHKGLVWSVNAKKSGINTEHFKRHIDQLLIMFDRYSKVFVLRFDLRFPDDMKATDDSKVLSIFLRRLRKQIKAHYGNMSIGYSWCREQERAKHQHYHLVLMLNGHKVQSAKWLCSRIRKIWSDVAGGTPHWSRYYRVNREQFKQCQSGLDNTDKINSVNRAVFHISYLFKGRGKGYQPKTSHSYGHSRLKSRVIL